MSPPDVTVSVVSHRQNALVNSLLADLERHCAARITVVVTENVPDDAPLELAPLHFPVHVTRNTAVKGFGANHNAAFSHCRTPYYCVANPDIRLDADPFPSLIHALAAPGAGVAGPLVRNPGGGVEDSARRFPTLGSLLKKAFREQPGPEYAPAGEPVAVDWVAGMFMLFRSEAFRAVGGFDERFFLYYEDVDLCARLRARGLRTIFDPRTTAIHDARRASRRDLRLMAIHMASALRYMAGNYR